MALALRLALAAVLGVAAVLKLARRRETAASLSSLGAPKWTVLPLVVVEAALAIGVAAGSAVAMYGAAALMLVFAAVLVAAIRHGAAGRPCPCFGARGRVGWLAVGRNVGFAAAYAALPWAPSLGTDGWLAAGLVVALTAVAVLAVAVLALARELGELRLRLPRDAALELASEGPEVGERSGLIETFPLGPDTRFALAVFSSDGCRLCAALEPAVAMLARDPFLAVETFDEVRDRDVWDELAVPGSPYAVAFDADGIVRAKGTFNSPAQLEGIVATAERRAHEEARA